MVRQFSSFVVVSCLATSAHYTLLIGLVEMAKISPVPAALAGFTAGGIVSYALNRRHVFRSSLPHELTASRFALVAAVGFGLTYLFMMLLAGKAKVPYILAQVITTGLVMIWNFTAHKMWTFAAQS